MKKTDIAMIVLIASLSVLVSYFIASATPLGSAVDEPVQIDTIDKISEEIVQPDPAIFNEDALNPSVEVQIEDRENADVAND